MATFAVSVLSGKVFANHAPDDRAICVQVRSQLKDKRKILEPSFTFFAFIIRKNKEKQNLDIFSRIIV